MKRRSKLPKKLKDREGRQQSNYQTKDRPALVAGGDTAIEAAMMKARAQRVEKAAAATIKSMPRHQRVKLGTKDSHSSA